MHRIYISPLTAGLIIFFSLSGLYSEGNVAQVIQAGVIRCGEVTVFYPEQWALTKAQYGSDLKGGISLEYGNAPSENQEPDWIRLNIRQFNCRDCYAGEHKATMADYVKEMDCKKSRHFDVPFGCGSYFSRKSIKGTYYYYFTQDLKSFFKEGDDFTEVTVLFNKKGFFYVAQLHFPINKYDNYKRQLDYVVQNFQVNNSLKGKQ